MLSGKQHQNGFVEITNRFVVFVHLMVVVRDDGSSREICTTNTQQSTKDLFVSVFLSLFTFLQLWFEVVVMRRSKRQNVCFMLLDFS